MKRTLFGTDGIRGTANTEPMTAETALRVAVGAARQLRQGDHRHTVVIGKDTRLSGYMLEPAMTAGFVSAGMDVVLVGPIPTPAIAMLTRSLRADLGVMISASHNPHEDNGIKLFGPDGYKLSDQSEAAIEGFLVEGLDDARVAPTELGRARRLTDAGGRYIEFVKNTFPRGLRLDGLKIVVDCANGAAYKAAPAVLYELGADVVAIGVDPDGFNINRECGATATQAMRRRVVEVGAHLGIALDGDADRVIIADETGAILDGDQLLACIAGRWAEEGRLQGEGVVATVMSNLGLERFLGARDIPLLRTAVGDRYVVERMRQGGSNLGGEQSGHLILGDHGTTGDGIVAALQFLAELVLTGRHASEIGRVFTPLPQLLKNVRAPGALMAHPQFQQAVAQAERRLGRAGRLLIRKSGTEPLIRVMAEGEDAAMVRTLVDDLCAVLERVAAEGTASAAAE